MRGCAGVGAVYMDSGDDLLTTGQAARAAAVSVVTLARWADSGKLPAIRLSAGLPVNPPSRPGRISSAYASRASPLDANVVADGLMTIAEAGAFLRISRSWPYEAMEGGLLARKRS